MRSPKAYVNRIDGRMRLECRARTLINVIVPALFAVRGISFRNTRSDLCPILCRADTILLYTPLSLRRDATHRRDHPVCGSCLSAVLRIAFIAACTIYSRRILHHYVDITRFELCRNDMREDQSLLLRRRFSNNFLKKEDTVINSLLIILMIVDNKRDSRFD